MRGLALAAAFAAVALAASAPAARLAPSLQLLKLDPVTVAGAHFRPLGRVQVTVYVAKAQTRTARAGTSGRFRLAFAGITVTGCGSGQVRAVGSHGELVRLKIPSPACMAH